MYSIDTPCIVFPSQPYIFSNVTSIPCPLSSRDKIGFRPEGLDPHDRNFGHEGGSKPSCIATVTTSFANRSSARVQTFTLDPTTHPPYTLSMIVFLKSESASTVSNPFWDAVIMRSTMELCPPATVTNLASCCARGLSILPSYTAHTA